MDLDEKLVTHQPAGSPEAGAETVGAPAPLPILLRVPWLPPEAPAAVPPAPPEAPPRYYPLVVQRESAAPAEPPPLRRRPWRRWVAAIALGITLAGGASWWAWRQPAGESLSAGGGDPDEGVERLPPLQPTGVSDRPAPSRCAARLAPEIIPLDAGETP
jgi:hypothetical protein